MSRLFSATFFVLLLASLMGVSASSVASSGCALSLRVDPTDLVENVSFYLDKGEDEVISALNAKSKVGVKEVTDSEVVLKNGLVLKIEQRDPDGKTLHLIFPTGLRASATLITSALRRVLHNEYLFRFELNPGYTVDLNGTLRRPLPSDIGRTHPEFFRSRAEKQLRVSKSFAEAGEKQRQEDIENQTLGFEYLWVNLTPSPDLEGFSDYGLKRLSQIHLGVFKLNSLYGFSETYDSNTTLKRDGVVLAKTRQQIASTFPSPIPVDFRNPENGLQYVVSKNVETLLKTWMERFNAIRMGADVREIAFLYQSYVFLHPYISKEPRAAAALLDIMLNRGGYPLLDFQGPYTDVFYKSVDQLAVEIHSALNKAIAE